jgi:hypothetical protein
LDTSLLATTIDVNNKLIKKEEAKKGLKLSKNWARFIASKVGREKQGAVVE